MKNKPKVMILEFIMLIQILVTILIDLIYMDKNLIEKSTIAYSTVTIVIILAKLKVEGPRTPFLFMILDHVLIMFSRQSHHSSQVILSFIVITSLVSFILLIYLPLYQFPVPSGDYDVGFMELQFKINNKPVSVYYPVDKDPSNRKYKKNTLQIRKRKYINDLYHAFKNQLFLIPPIQLIQMCLGHLYKSTMEVHPNAPITSEISKPIPIIFCNGLMAIRDHYSCILRELASQGHVVFAPQLDEEFNIVSKEDLELIKSRKIKLEDDIELIERLKLIRNEQLNARVKCVQLLIEKVANDQFIKTIFRSKTIQLNMDKLIGAGHSFGGSTVYETAIIDKRINGGLILYDPWFIPLPKTSINQNILLPILCINSETFKNIPLVKENILISKQLFEAQRQKTFLCLELTGSDHAHQSDLVYLMPGEMKLLKEINNTENITQFTTSNLRLTNLFISKAILQQISPKKANSILKEFDQFANKNYHKKNQIYNILYTSR